jgi:hypothetical protein
MHTCRVIIDTLAPNQKSTCVRYLDLLTSPESEKKKSEKVSISHAAREDAAAAKIHSHEASNAIEIRC